MEPCSVHHRIEKLIESGDEFRGKVITMEAIIHNHENWICKIDQKLDNISAKTAWIVGILVGAMNAITIITVFFFQR